MGMEFLKLLTFIIMIPSFNLLLVGMDEEAPRLRRMGAGVGLISMAGFLGIMTILFC
ncbi:hypothetical protein [Paenibacillus sp. EPM92]|uniref:hypothetical protein n=1 Tax=Paenibacillus sp. EPM92 TaxID=1561195 RepID=UPI001916BC3C|nr:hypothetical protein [Paenibacillus sp. EPM92]